MKIYTNVFALKQNKLFGTKNARQTALATVIVHAGRTARTAQRISRFSEQGKWGLPEKTGTICFE